MCVYIHVCIGACECPELVPSKIMANVIFVLYLSLVDYMMKGSGSFTYHFCLFCFHYMHSLIKFTTTGYV